MNTGMVIGLTTACSRLSISCGAARNSGLARRMASGKNGAFSPHPSPHFSLAVSRAPPQLIERLEQAVLQEKRARSCQYYGKGYQNSQQGHLTKQLEGLDTI